MPISSAAALEHDVDDLGDDDLDDCWDCGSVAPGVLSDVDFAGGIQRCDSCAVYEGDLEAAAAAAALVGGTVWFMADSDESNLPEGVRTQWSGSGRSGEDADVVLATGNNPWVELDGVLVVWAHTRLLLDGPREVIVTANKLARTWKGTSEELVEAARAVHAPAVTASPA